MPTKDYDKHVRRSGEDYTAAYLGLMPTGQAWPRSPESVLVKAVTGLCLYWGFVDGRAADLLEIESDPRKTHELLTDWERNWGLPDPCFPDAVSEEDRRRMLVMVMTMLGGQSISFYEWVSAWVGYDLQVKEYSPYMCGISEVGDTRYVYDDTGEWRWMLGTEEMRFYWAIRADEAILQWFRAGAGGGECGVDHHLEIILQSPIDCLLQRWKPAHTALVFDYSALEDMGPMAGTP